jgi:hypothetical protein
VNHRFLRSLTYFFGDRAFVRSIYADELLEDFLVAAVVSVLGIRLYLALTGFPIIGPGGLHIAHMLWGGLLMLAALIILMASLGRTSRQVAAIAGGVGFGTFIDELGKFVTKDHDYFFQPTVALIYITFILIYLATKALTQNGLRSEREYLANVLEVVKQGVINDLSPEEKERAHELLEKCDPNDPLVRELYVMLERMSESRPRRHHLFGRVRALARDGYTRLATQSWFTTAILGLFVLQSISALAERVALVQWSLGLGIWLMAALALLVLLALFRLARPLSMEIMVSGGIVAVVAAITWNITLNLESGPLSFIEWGQLVFPTLSSLFVVVGIAQLLRSRLDALRTFERAVLVSILLTQVYTFYTDRFVALGGLAVNILILMTLRYLIASEHARLEQEKTHQAFLKGLDMPAVAAQGGSKKPSHTPS